MTPCRDPTRCADPFLLPPQAYCEKTETGLLECARKRGGGRCDPLNNKFVSTKTSDAPPKSLAKRKERKTSKKG